MTCNFLLGHSIALSSDSAAYKPGGHELSGRKQQLIFTDCCDYRFIKTVVCERVKFVDPLNAFRPLQRMMKSHTSSPVDLRIDCTWSPKGTSCRAPSIRLSAA
jgi:hypothetical protein